jgi:predicted esterase
MARGGPFASLRTPTTLLVRPRASSTRRVASDAVARMAEPRRLRVLCLHSFRTSSDILRTQMEIAGWEQSLGDLVEFTCAPDGHPASGEVPKDVAMFFPDAEYYEWWNATKNEDGVVEYRGVEASLEKVRQRFAADAFDGVLGFSQGATLTTVLAAKGAAEGWGPFADARGGASGDESAAMTFAVCVGGMLARTPAARDLYERARAVRASTPSLHLIGDADRVMPPSFSERAAEQFLDATTVRHARGHVIPKLEGATLETVRAFFEAQRAKRGGAETRASAL